MNTDAEICMALTRQSPSTTPLFRTSFSTASVILTKPRRPGTSNHKYSVNDFTPELYHEMRHAPSMSPWQGFIEFALRHCDRINVSVQHEGVNFAVRVFGKAGDVFRLLEQ